MKVTAIGVDLAKRVFQVHGVDERGHVVVRRQLRRDQVAAFFANIPACLVGMEACGSAHHWARKLQGFGHEVRLISPQFVKPYVKSNKNDVADAEAICEAVTRPNMRFVPIKTVEQQKRAFGAPGTTGIRQGQDGAGEPDSRLAGRVRTGAAAGDRACLAGSAAAHRRGDRAAIIDASAHRTAPRKHEGAGSAGQRTWGANQAWHQRSPLSRKLEKIPGVGPLAASAMVASLGDARSFENGRQVAAWLGLVPKQDSSGGKPKLEWANAATPIFGRCWSTVRARRSWPRSAKPHPTRITFADKQGDPAILAEEACLRLDHT
jgi:transposase